MQIEESTTLAATPEQVVQLMCTESFQAEKAAKLNTTAFTFTTNRTDAGTEVVTTRASVSDAMPEFLKALAAKNLVTTETEVWGSPRDNEHRGTFSVDVAGAPVKLRGEVVAQPSDGGNSTTLTFRGEWRSTVPMFRSQIEQFSSKTLLDTIHTEFSLLQDNFDR